MLNLEFVVSVLIAAVDALVSLVIEQQAFVFCFRIILQQGSPI